MLPWIPTRYPLTHFFKKYIYIYIHHIDALNEPPVHYWEKKLNPPMFASIPHRKFYDVIIL